MKHFVDFDYSTNEYVILCSKVRFPGYYVGAITFRSFVIPVEKQEEYTDMVHVTTCHKCIACLIERYP